ncbi:hypothetical protein Q9233_012819 [Columba guinea]|nr:hypothetical protein Q9233_012819 [Columba guinea]
MKVGKKSVTEDLVTTFSSPAAWILVVALIVTWSAVAIVMFDLVDYKAFAGRSVNKLSTEPLRIIHQTLEESTDWLYGFISFLSDIVWSDDDDSDEGEVEPSLKKEEKKVKSTKVEAKVKKEVKDGKGEGKTTEKVKQAETKTTEVGLIKAKPKVKEEKALQTITKSEKKDQYAFCRYVIDMFAQGDFYPGIQLMKFLYLDRGCGYKFSILIGIKSHEIINLATGNIDHGHTSPVYKPLERLEFACCNNWFSVRLDLHYDWCGNSEDGERFLVVAMSVNVLCRSGLISPCRFRERFQLRERNATLNICGILRSTTAEFTAVNPRQLL